MFKNIIGLMNPYAQEKNKQKEKQPTQEEYYRELEIDTLARTIFGEARGEPVEGMEAVASVILNRARISQKKGRYWWGTGIIGVCQKPYQFSCWNKGDPSYHRLINVTADNIHFATALRIARRAVINALRDNTNGATHYHADYIAPYWAQGERPVKTIGRHIFYKLVN
jgi:spore germination cell wall hydrolase CwlJ-like protein